MNKKIMVAVLTSGLFLTGCGVTSTAPDEQEIRYSNPMLGAKEFKECYGASAFDTYTLMNDAYTYPAGQRVYAFQYEGGDGGTFNVPTKDGVSLTVSGAVRFQLTNDCEAFKQFHERVGLKMKAYEEDGWREFLKVYINAPINRALTDATQGMSWQAIYSDPKAKSDWERKVTELLPKYIEQAAGGDYLTNIEVTLQKPKLPEDLEKSLEAAQVAVQREKAQEAQNDQVRTEIESIRELVAVLGVEGYNVYQAIKDGRIQIMPVPEGAGVNVQGGKSDER